MAIYGPERTQNTKDMAEWESPKIDINKVGTVLQDTLYYNLISSLHLLGLKLNAFGFWPEAHILDWRHPGDLIRPAQALDFKRELLLPSVGMGDPSSSQNCVPVGQCKHTINETNKILYGASGKVSKKN